MRCLQLLFFLLALLPAAAALSGGGPENVLLVVNQNSADSKTLANYYVRVRDIPPRNVLQLDWRGSLEMASSKVFTEKILKPILATIEKRRLVPQIDYVVYSTDFPWSIDFSPTFKDEKLPKEVKPITSLTGATYLWQHVMAQSPTLLSLATNWYVPDPSSRNLARCVKLADVPSHGFHARTTWLPGAEVSPDPQKGQRFFLSSMLGVTQGRGTTVEEAARGLIDSQAADYTRPDGIFYFMKNSDIRSVTRHNCFQGVASQLRAAGAKAVVADGVLPQGAGDVVGLTVGAEEFDLNAANLRIKPGAICEHLTSYGGVMRANGYQTPLSVFLKAGATGASGTVCEPRAIQAKFPLPTVHLHYYRGCSLAEAFYQSVAAPYQLLIVGDPLCQPWARPPECTAEEFEDGQLVKDTLLVKPKTVGSVKACEVYLDGVLRARVKPDGSATVSTANMPPGYHEFRLVAIDGAPIETRGAYTASFRVGAGSNPPLQVRTQPARWADADDDITLTAEGGSAKRVVFRQNSQTLGRASGDSLSLTVRASDLGRGPVRLHAVDPVSGEQSAPLWLWIR